MMYSEFVKGTGCKENEHNYNIFLKLEDLYMNSDITKEDVYKFGKKLVDNSKTEEQIKLEEELKAQIEECKKEIAYWQERAKFYLEVMEDKKESKRYLELARSIKARMNGLKFVLG